MAAAPALGAWDEAMGWHRASSGLQCHQCSYGDRQERHHHLAQSNICGNSKTIRFAVSFKA